MAGEGVLPPVEGSLVWSVTQFLAANDEAIASLRELAAETESSASKIRASTAEMAGSETAAADETAAASARMGEESALSADASDAAAARGVKADEELGASHGQLANDASNLAGASRTASEDVTTATEDMSAKGVAADEKLSKAHGQVAADVSNLAGSTTKSSKEIGSSAESGSSKASSAFSSMGKWALLGGVGVAAASVKMAMTWQESMTQLVTGAGQSEKGIAAVSNALLNMSVATDTSMSQMSAGMYMIESAGFHGAQGLQVLKAAAEGAKVGNADLGTMANVVTSALKAYHEPAADAVRVTNELVATVASGKMHMQDLGTSLANVLPIAASVHVSFAQVGGALATMTGMGMTARRASMNLANMLRSLVATAGPASAEMKRLGLNANQVSNDLGKQGITGTLDELTSAILRNTKGGSVLDEGFQSMGSSAKTLALRILDNKITTDQLSAAMKDLSPIQAKMVSNFQAQATSATGVKKTFDAAMKTMVGGATGLNVALMLGGQNASTFAANVKTVGDAANKTGANVTGWKLVQADLGFQLGQFGKLVEADSVKLGQALIPEIEHAIHVVSDVTTWFDRNRVVAEALGGVIGVVLTAAVAKYVYEEGQMVAKTVKNYAQMVRSVAGWVGAHTGMTQKVMADNAEQAASTTASNDKIIASNEEVSASEAGVGASGGLEAIGQDAGAARGEVAGLTGSLSSLMIPLAAVAGITIGAVKLSDWLNVPNAAVTSFLNTTHAAQGLATSLPNLQTQFRSLTGDLNSVNAAYRAGKVPAIEYQTQVHLLSSLLAENRAKLADYTSNTNDFSKALGLSSDQVTNLAKSLNVNLYGALNQSATVDRMRQAIAGLASSAGLTSSGLIAMANSTHTSMASVASSISSATSGASTAWSNFSSTLSNTTGQTAGQIKTFYSSQEKSGASFVTNIQKAIADGYNPSYIENLLQQGPQAASQLLQQLVSTQGDGMAQMINQTQAKIAQQGALAVTEAKITAEGVKYQGTAMAQNLSAALALATAATSSNAQAQISAVMGKYHLGFPQVESIAKAYGVALPSAAMGEIGATAAAASSLAQAFTGGMTAGINGGINAVIAAAGNYSTQALNAARAAIHAKSPSQDTRKLGQDFAQGGAIGLLESMHLFSDAAAQMAHGGLAAMAGTAGRVAVGTTTAGAGGGSIGGSGGGVVNNWGGIHVTVAGTNASAQEIADKVRDTLLRTTARQVGPKGLWGR